MKQYNPPLISRVQIAPQTRYAQKSITQRQNERLRSLPERIHLVLDFGILLRFSCGGKNMNELTADEIDKLRLLQDNYLQNCKRVSDEFMGRLYKNLAPSFPGALEKGIKTTWYI